MSINHCIWSNWREMVNFMGKLRDCCVLEFSYSLIDTEPVKRIEVECLRSFQELFPQN
jgi:hypothetical protein